MCLTSIISIPVWRKGELPVEGSSTFMETTGETVVNEGTFEDVAEGIFHGHAGFGGVGRDFDLFGLLRDIITFYTGGN